MIIFKTTTLIISHVIHSYTIYQYRFTSTSILIADARESVDNTLLYYGTNGQDGANLALNYDLLSQIQTGCNGICMNGVVNDWLSNKEDHVTTNWMVSDVY